MTKTRISGHMRRAAWLGLALSVAGPLPLAAQPAPAPAIAAKPLPLIELTTSEGVITIMLETEKAPLSSSNFLRYVDQKRLDGTTFYRAMTFPRDPPIGLVQGGTRGVAKLQLPAIAHEPTSKTGLSHDDMAISFARAAPGTAQGDFFIIVGDGMQGLNADPARDGDNQGYAVFGHVVAGQDVVRHILAAPTSTTEGEGAMKGQMIKAPVRILTARRARPAASG